MSSTRKLVYKKLSAYNTIWHPESTLVFKSQKERDVIGRYVDGEVISLDQEAVDLCGDWKFNPDASLLEELEAEEEEAEEEEAEEEEAEEEAEEEEAEEEEAEEEEEEEAEEEEEVVEHKAIKPKQSESNSDIEEFVEMISTQITTFCGNFQEQDSELQTRVHTLEKENEKLKKDYEKLKKEYSEIKSNFDAVKAMFGK